MNSILHELRALDTGLPALRRFGRTVGGVFALIAAFLLWRAAGTPTPAVWTTGGIGLALIGLGLAAPRLLRPVYCAWMALAFAMGFVMTRVLLTAVFFLLVTPIGWAMRLSGRDPMRRRPAASYWLPRTDAPEGQRMRQLW